MSTPAESPAHGPSPAVETDDDSRRTFVWNRYNDTIKARSANDPQARRLAAWARRASGAQPGMHPDVWPLYRTVDFYGNHISWEGPQFSAEHLAIGLWGQHQQGNSRPMHVEGEDLGKACLALFRKRSKKDSPMSADMDDAISRRLRVIVRTGDVTVAGRHLKSLVNFLGSEGIPTDYTRLFHALANWGDSDKHPRDLRQWASSYQRTTKAAPATTTEKD